MSRSSQQPKGSPQKQTHQMSDWGYLLEASDPSLSSGKEQDVNEAHSIKIISAGQNAGIDLVSLLPFSETSPPGPCSPQHVDA